MKTKLLLTLFSIYIALRSLSGQTPSLVKDLQAGNWSNTNRILIDNQWYFITDGNKLWKTDGTSMGTTLLKTFSATSVFNFMEISGKLLLFVDNDGDGKIELWRSDGTSAGTVMVKDLQATKWSTVNIIYINNQWFFATEGNKLWKTDGTSVGTTLLKTFGSTSIYTFHELNGKLLLLTDNDVDGKMELWSSDGTSSGTLQIKDLQATSWSGVNRLLVNNQWFFATNGNKLWKTDGTAVGTTLLKTFACADLYTFHQANGKLLLFADNDLDTKLELWRSDGTIAGTVQVKDLQASQLNANRIFINNEWYFTTDGKKLWKTDASSVGTTLLKTFACASVYTFHELNGKLLLIADNDLDTKMELWTSNGTSAGTQQIKDLQASKWSTANRLLVNNMWFFTTEDKVLWKTDGTSVGTSILKTFGGTNLYTFHELNNKLLLLADNNADGKVELWSSDGTNAGTKEIKNLVATKWSNTNRLLINNIWYFSLEDNQLWKTDGTALGTVKLKTFSCPTIYNFHTVPDKLLLIADDDGDSKAELWGLDAPYAVGTGIHDLTTMAKQPDIYPNPFTDNITININDSRFTSGELYITNGLGQTVYRKKLTTGTQTIQTELSSGIYFYKIVTAQEVIATGRLIRQ
jgi:ELWxxDGT repeat protein